LAQCELPVAQIVVRERRCVLLNRAALDRFLERAPAVEARAHAAPAPALAREVLVAQGAGLDLQVGQLELFPQPIDDVVDLELEHELIAAFVVTPGAFAVALRGPREHVAGLAVALADTLALAGLAQPEPRMLEEVHGHLHRAVGTRHHLAVRDELGKLLADGGAHFVVVAQPIARAAREQVIPIAVGPRALDEVGRVASHRPLSSSPIPATAAWLRNSAPLSRRARRTRTL
jgi:hypothetical protein